ncbi:MAG: DNA repair protein RecN [Clostridia bacterium]|nr:DNA repair protein RecN [Clostridia bacterium]
MLRELHIKNVAVIEEVTIEFNNGFQALTGETGAGKSILIDSINMALGGRGNRELIRTGAEFASVDLAFEIEDRETIEKLEELGIDCEDYMVAISRRIFPDGKSKCHINGRLTPLNVVKEAGELLLTIHGQNDNQSILSPKSHIHFVDEYAGAGTILDEYREQYSLLKKIKASLKELDTDESEKERLVELLSFQINEIEGAKLKADEEDALLERRKFLQNAEQIAESAGGAYYALHGSDESDNGACDAVGDALRRLEAVREYDARLDGFYNTLSSVMADMEDVTYELRSYLGDVDYSQAELDATEERLSVIADLKRKYGQSIEQILEFAKSSRARLETIEKSDEKRAELLQSLADETKKLAEISDRLTKLRLDAAMRLQESVMNELLDLDMQKMRFSVSVSPITDEAGETKFTSDGCDCVEFLISANPGEDLKPLSKIASGGEMSRIMLALKSVLSDTDSVETLIFDEIDTGVSGRAAQKIAEKMGMLAKKRQLLCITHLAQIAAMADHHYLIEKTSGEDTTRTTVCEVSGEERITELARIIGGVMVTELTASAAREMLDMAAEYKNSAR